MYFHPFQIVKSESIEK